MYKFTTSQEVIAYNALSIQKKAKFMSEQIKPIARTNLHNNTYYSFSSQSKQFQCITEHEFKYIILGEFFDQTADYIRDKHPQLANIVPNLIVDIGNSIENDRFYETLKAYLNSSLESMIYVDPIEHGVDQTDQSINTQQPLKDVIKLFKDKYNNIAKTHFTLTRDFNKITNKLDKFDEDEHAISQEDTREFFDAIDELCGLKPSKQIIDDESDDESSLLFSQDELDD